MRQQIYEMPPYHDQDIQHENQHHVGDTPGGPGGQMNLPCTNLREYSRQRGGQHFGCPSLRPLPHSSAMRRHGNDHRRRQLHEERRYGHFVNSWPIRRGQSCPRFVPKLAADCRRDCDTQQILPRCSRHGRRGGQQPLIEHHYGHFVNFLAIRPKIWVAQQNLGGLRFGAHMAAVFRADPRHTVWRAPWRWLRRAGRESVSHRLPS